MKADIRKRQKDEKGFTLVELLVAFAIIALLAMIIVPRVMTALDQSKERTDAANAKLLQSAVERYYFDNGKYPTTDGTDGGDAGTEIDVQELIDAGYIDADPGDPWASEGEEGRNYTIQNGVVQKLGKPAD